mgnify:CR=1 FL=1
MNHPHLDLTNYRPYIKDFRFYSSNMFERDRMFSKPEIVEPEIKSPLRSLIERETLKSEGRI